MLAVELIAETVFPEIVLLFAPESIMPKELAFPVIAIPVTVLLAITMLGEKPPIPYVLRPAPAAVRDEIVLFETLRFVEFVPTLAWMPAAPAVPVLLEVRFVILLPVTLALSVPEPSKMPTTCSAIASEILPKLLLEMVTPLVP